MNNPFTLENKTILILGASSGIGRETAKLCSVMGAKVVLAGRDEVRLKETLAMLTGSGHSIINFDLCDESSWVSRLSKIPAVDGVAACAGVALMKPFAFVTVEDMQCVFQTNVFGQVSVVQSLLKKRLLNKGASVVFVSSVDGNLKVHAGNSVYSASKSALVGLARNMAIDLSGKKIRINCVLPGTTDTKMIRTDNVTEEELLAVANKTPMRRFASAAEVANGIAFLLTDAASYISGTELVIDGASHLI